MNGKDLLISLGNISHKYYEEAENDNLVKAQKHKTIRRPLMVAAIIALTLLLVGCAVAYANGWFEELFAARSDTPLTDGQVEFIQENEHIIMETQSSNEWNVELKSTMTDGKTGYILFGITAPSNINLEEYYENGKGDFNAPDIMPGNHSIGGAARPIVMVSTGFWNEELNINWQELSKRPPSQP